MDYFADNLRRLMGLHGIKASTQGVELFELSAQALSGLQRGSRTPHVKSLQRIAAFFEIPIDRLLNAPFEQLLATELANPDRYLRVEEKIRNQTTKTQTRS